MNRKLSFAVLAALGAFVLVLLSGVPLPYPAHAQAPPSVAVSLSSASVEEGTAITVTMSFGGLESDADTATRDYLFRADVVGADGCEDQAGGYGLGVDRSMWQVDQDPEVRTGSVSADCPAGDYTVEAVLNAPDETRIASARASFTVTAPAPTPTPEPTPEPTPLVAIALFPSSSVEQGTAIAVTIGFIGLQSNWDTGTTDYIFRADVVDADACEGDGLGVDRYMHQVDEDPETRTGTISADCPAGDYTLKASISSPDRVEVASARASFSVAEPEEEEDDPPDSVQQQATPVDITLHSQNEAPLGVWSDGTTVWVVDGGDHKLYAYTLSSGARDSARDIALDGANRHAGGAWSDGTTIWVADDSDDKLYAYTLSGGARDSSKEFGLASRSSGGTFAADDNGRPVGVWSDGTTIWVADNDDRKLYAYTLSNGSRDTAKEFSVRQGSQTHGGVWSDGTTIWVVYQGFNKARAYTISSGSHDAGLDLSLRISSNNWGVWSDGTTMWVGNRVNRKLFHHPLPGTTSTDAALSELSVSGVTLSPVFAADTTSYTASVANSVTSTTVTATPNDNDAKVVTTPADADDNADGHQVNLDVGSNTISVKVTAEDDTTTRTYTVTVTRADPPRDVVTVPADWTLKPSGLGVGDQFRLLIVTSTTRNANSTDISDYDTHVQTAVAAGHAGIQSHSSQFKVLGSTASVAARDHTETTYTSADKGVPIYWLGGAKAADEYEDFYDGSWDSYVFRAQTGQETSPHRVWTGTNNDGTAATNFLGSTSGVGAGTKASGKHFVNSVLSSGTTYPFYGLSPVFQVAAAVTPPTLSALTVSAGTLTPGFAGGTLAYTVPGVPYGNNRITVTATADADATVSYEDGAGNTLSDVDADTAGDQFDLAVGENTIKVKLTKGSASQTYTLTLTRAAPAVSIGAAAATAGEGDSLTFTVTRTPAAGDALTLTVNVAESGDLVSAASEGAYPVTIAADATEETLVVATETDDTDWEEHSTVSVTASPSTGYTLGAASASTLVEDDDFPAATAALAVSPTTVGEPGTVSVSVTVTTNADQEPHGPGGTVTATAGGGTATSGSDYDAFSPSYTLNPDGFSVVTVGGSQRWQRVYTGTVAVRDDTTQESAETFNVALTKSGAPKVTLASPSTVAVTIRASDAPTASSDASLSALSLSSGTLSPGFAGDTISYAASVASNVSSTTVTATTNHAAASVLITPTDADANRAGDQVNLDVGSNTISVKVTAEDGTTRTYTVTVTRAAPPPSSDASLSALALSGVTLSPTFAAARTSYTASVANSVSSTTVTATKNHAAATVVITPADADANAAGRQVSLTVGFNTVTVKVTAEDGATTRTYTVTVTRATALVPAVSSDASLSALALSGVTLSPAFAGAATSYTASVANSVSSTTVTATKNQAAATVVITPTDADVSATGYQVGLNVGSNTITVKVTAADGVTTRTYTVTITRAATGAAPSDITLQAKVLVTETVYEPQGGVIVGVRVRTDSYERPQRSLTLTVQSFPDTAHVGTDYLPFTATTVTFNPDDFFGYYDSGFFEAIKHVAQFRIVDDNTQESNEQLIISVSTAASSASIATTQGAIVTIEDGDEPLAPTSLRQPRVTSAIYDATKDAVVLKWAAGSDTQGLTGYRVDRSAPGGATELTHADLRGDDRPAVASDVLTWNDTTVPASYLVLYRVWAVFSDGSEVASYAFPATMDRGIVRARETSEGSDNRFDVSWTDAAYPLGDGSLHYGVCPEGYKVYLQLTIGGTTSWNDVSASDTDPAERTYVATGLTTLVLGAEVPFMVRCGGDSETTGLLIGEDTATVQ